MFDASSLGSSLSARLTAVRFSRANLWTLVKVLLAFGLLAILLSRTSFAEIAAVLQHAVPLWLAVSFVAFCAITWGMARRYWLLIGREIPFHALLGLVILQTVLGNVVATSAGAISYVAMLRGKYKVRAAQSISSLIIARVGDALVLWVALMYAATRVWAQVEPLHWLVIGVLAALGGLLAVCALVLLLRERLVRRIEWLLSKIRLDKVAFVKKGMDSLRALAQIPIAELVSLGLPVLLWSVILSGLNVGFAFANMQMFQVPIALDALVFAFCLTQLFSLIPIQVFGGLGVYEVTALALYSFFGLDAALLAPVLFGMRILFYMFNLSLLLYLPFENRFGAKPA